MRKRTDVLLVGAGIMSATLAAMLKELKPELDIVVFEKLDAPAEESSNEWNNAGTGHSALCELNYTVERSNGEMDISKAIKINEEFQVSRQFWSHLVTKNVIQDPKEFITSIPHMSLVHGEENVAFLKKRYEALSVHPLFQGMEFSDNPEVLKEWIPLIMEGRSLTEPIAATKIESGTDVNFGALTRRLFEYLQGENVAVHFKHQVESFQRLSNRLWEVTVRNLRNGLIEYYETPFLFIGAGGNSLPLLQKTGIPESKHVGGFPVSGMFMVCNNPEVIERHHAKVYGKAPVGAPPMSVPHLDTRTIDGKKALLFGPFAGFSPKFLKTGSNLDLFRSIQSSNFGTMAAAGMKNMTLTKYLIQQVLLSKEARMQELRDFIPNAKNEDWDLIVAGQRVQIIQAKGILQFGTEVITSEDGSVSALLGASPGASTAVYIMLEVLKKCFSDHIDNWESKLKEMIPFYDLTMLEDPERIRKVHTSTAQILELKE